MKLKFTKLIIIFLSISLLLIGCKNTTVDTTKEDNELTIVTSFYPMYISALNVVKDIPNVNLINLTQPQTGCLHDYQLTPADLKTLSKADIFVINGLGMESFLDDVISQYKDIHMINASEGISLLEATSTHEHHHEDDENCTIEEHNHDEDHKNESHDHDHDHNPHVWVSISKNIDQVKNIADQLSSLDPQNASLYKSNSEKYIRELEDLRDEMHLALDNVSNRDIITFHEAFPYFAEEFNLNIAGILELEPNVEPSAKQLEEIIETVKEKNITALFIEPQYSPKAAETVANETVAKIYTLDPIVTGESNEDAAHDYINKMKENLNVLKEALK